ncbi:B3/B4 domain-containing protein [Paucilactobacillus sp. N302-9]
MKKFVIDPEVIELFPDVQINLLRLSDFDNHVQESKQDTFQQLLVDAEKEAQQYVTVEPFRNNPVVSQWRDAFTKFKTKKGARSSIEALLKRVSQGHEFTPIIPLVDIYNSVSLKYAVPVGGETISAIDGDLHLGVADGGESFKPLGATEDAPALPGEVIYYDQTGAVCRCFNWREAQRTMLTEETTDAVMVVEAINQEKAVRANAAIDELKKLVDQTFAIQSTSSSLNAQTLEIAL